VVVSDTGDWINHEEYTPYGETSFGSFARKRYRFTGKERDEESGLYYHGARYYAPWLARWVSCDPAGSVGSLNLYRYASGQPMRRVDPSGMQDEPISTPAEPPPPQASGHDPEAYVYQSPERQCTICSPSEESPQLNDLEGEPILDGPNVIKGQFEQPPAPPQEPPGGGGYGGDPAAIDYGEVAKHGVAGVSFGAAAAAAGRLVGGAALFVITLPFTLGSDQPSPEVEKSPQQKANEAALIAGSLAGGAAVERGVPRASAGQGAGGPPAVEAARTVAGRIQKAIRNLRKQNVEADIWEMSDIYHKQGRAEMLKEVQHLAKTPAGRRSLQELDTRVNQIEPRNPEERGFLISLSYAIRQTLNP
jgi:RHS repeat-associated protein